MPDCPQWSAPERDDQLQYVAAGLADYYRFIISACKRRYILQHGDIKTYHKKVFLKVVPLDYYAGNYRSPDPAKPCLAQDVQVDGVLGESYISVPSSMSVFSNKLRDLVLASDDYPSDALSPSERAQAVAQLGAAAMGEVIRIHPFINGNGRMARMLVNYIFRRYGYAMPFRQSRPLDLEYRQASAAAMGPSSNFSPLYIYILRLVASATI